MQINFVIFKNAEDKLSPKIHQKKHQKMQNLAYTGELSPKNQPLFMTGAGSSDLRGPGAVYGSNR